MEFIDTHSHLYDEAYGGEEDLAVERSITAGVTKVILPDIDSSTRDSMFALADRFPHSLMPCLGLHPTSVAADWEEELDKVLKALSERKVTAIGEVGIDCYWSKDFLNEQILVFKRMLDAALELSLPVIIHSRDSGDILPNILKEYKGKGLTGVFHAYSGSIETFREIQKLGDWYVGIGGVLTFKKASIAETVKEIPLDRILLETDAPYLTPAPYRGQRNESSYIPLIAEKLAQQKGISLEEVAAITTSNAKQLFNI